MSEQLAVYLNPVFWVIIAEISSVFLVPSAVVWYLFFHKLLVCDIVIPHGNAWQLTKRLKKKPETTNFDYKECTYVVDHKEQIVERANRIKIYWELGKDKPISLKAINKGDGKLAKTIYKNEALGRLLGRYREKFYWILIIGLICVIAGLSLYFQWQLGQNNDKWISLIQNITGSKPVGK